MIRIQITGHLGKDADIRTLQSGDMAIQFSVAHTEKHTKDGQTKENTTWLNCTRWVKQGQSTRIADYLKKGTKVYVEGTPSARGFTANNENKASLDCKVTMIELLGSASSNTDTNLVERPQEEYKDDLPF